MRTRTDGFFVALDLTANGERIGDRLRWLSIDLVGQVVARGDSPALPNGIVGSSSSFPDPDFVALDGNGDAYQILEDSSTEVVVRRTRAGATDEIVTKPASSSQPYLVGAVTALITGG